MFKQGDADKVCEPPHNGVIDEDSRIGLIICCDVFFCRMLEK